MQQGLSVIPAISLLSTAGVDSGAATAGAAATGGGAVDLRPSSGVRYQQARAHAALRSYHKSATQSISVAAALVTRGTLSGTGSTWAAFATGYEPAAVTVTATASGTVYTNVIWAVPLAGASRYIGVKVTPTPSTTATGMIYHLYGGFSLVEVSPLPAT